MILSIATVGAAESAQGDDIFVPMDGTFRDAASLSRFERASMLATRLPILRQLDAASVDAQIAELRPELAQLGVDADALAKGSPALTASYAFDDRLWGHPEKRDWLLHRMAAVNAFWTDPSSPTQFDAMPEVSGRPRIAPPSPPQFNLLAAWTPPAPGEDFLQSSFDSGLPPLARLAINPDLRPHLAFTPPSSEEPFVSDGLPRVVAAVEPGGVLPPNVTTLDSLARLGMTSPSLPRVTVKRPGLFGAAGTVPSVGPSGLPAPWLTGGGYEQSTGPSNFPTIPQRFASESDDSVRTFLNGGDAVGLGNPWSHASAVAGYPLKWRDVHLNFKLDEWTFGTHDSLGALGDGGRTFGLDHGKLQDAAVDLNLRVDPSLSFHGGYIYTRSSGLTSSAFNDANVNLGTTDRAFPYLGFDYKINNNARWNLNIRFYNTPLDVGNGVTAPRTPTNLTDPQVTTEFKVQF